MIRLCRYVPLLFTFVTASVQASSTMVTSVPDLQHAISFAHAGDTIILKNGLYVTHQAITISKVGTAIAPIFITAETIGGAEISGDSGFVVASPSAYIIVRGFKFTHSSSSARTRAGTQFCRWTQNVFETKGAGESLTIAGDDHTIEYNTFQHKNSMGRFLAIRGSGSQVAQRLWIHHNYFFDFADQGGANGAESLQFGLSGL